MKRTNLFLKYWYLWLIVLVLPIVLYVVIPLSCGLDAIGKEKAPELWLGFWGGYLGALISATVAFFILDKQLKKNHEENEQNRGLQLKNIQYQQQMQWLNDFRKIAAELSISLNLNDLTDAKQKIESDPNTSYYISKSLLENITLKSAMLEFYAKNDSAEEALAKDVSKYISQFLTVVCDMNFLAGFYISTANNTASSKFIPSPPSHDSPELLEFYNIIITNNKVEIQPFAKKRYESVANIPDLMTDLLKQHIIKEQQRINNILLQ